MGEAVGPGVVERRRPPLEHLHGEPDLRRVDVRHRQALDLPAFDDVDGAPVGEARDREPRNRGERLLVVERRREQRAGLGEERDPLLRLPLGLVERRLVHRERDPVGDQLEEARVLRREVRHLLRPGVHDADHALPDDERDRDDRPDPAQAKRGAHELDLVQVVDQERQPARSDASGEALAEGNRLRGLDLRLAEPGRGADRELRERLVGEEDDAGVGVHHAHDLVEQRVEQVRQRRVRERDLRHLGELLERGRRRLRRLARALLGDEEPRALALDARPADELADVAAERRDDVEQLGIGTALGPREELEHADDLPADERREAEARANPGQRRPGRVAVEIRDPPRRRRRPDLAGERLPARDASALERGRNRLEARLGVDVAAGRGGGTRLDRPVRARLPFEEADDRLQDARDHVVAAVGEDRGHSLLHPQPLLGPAPLGHLDQDAADAGHRAVVAEDRVVARRPDAPHAGPRRHLPLHLDLAPRLARREHPPEPVGERRADVGQDLDELAAEVGVDRETVHVGERLVDAHELELAAPEPEPDRGRREQRVEQRHRPDRLEQQTRVLDRRADAPGEVVCELHVLLVEAPRRIDEAERDRAEDPPACLDRHAHAREAIGGRFELAVARARDKPGAGAVPERRRGFRRSGRSHPPQRPVLVDEVDRDDVRHARHGELCHRAQRRLDVV